MNIMEIVLLVIGAIVFVLSFLIPDKDKKHISDVTVNTENVRQALDKEIESAKMKLQDELDETLTYAVEKSERALERISNEKIMAVSEFSDTVLEQINTNHKETIFLYDMLNDKQREINSTARYVNKTVKEHQTEAETRNQENVLPDIEDSNEIKLSSSNTDLFTISKNQETIQDEVKENEYNNNSNEKILSLYRQGLSKVAIAKELGLGVGEVKLVIDLFQGIQ